MKAARPLPPSIFNNNFVDTPLQINRVALKLEHAVDDYCQDDERPLEHNHSFIEKRWMGEKIRFPATYREAHSASEHRNTSNYGGGMGGMSMLSLTHRPESARRHTPTPPPVNSQAGAGASSHNHPHHPHHLTQKSTRFIRSGHKPISSFMDPDAGELKNMTGGTPKVLLDSVGRARKTTYDLRKNVESLQFRTKDMQAEISKLTRKSERHSKEKRELKEERDKWRDHSELVELQYKNANELLEKLQNNKKEEYAKMERMSTENENALTEQRGKLEQSEKKVITLKVELMSEQEQRSKLIRQVESMTAKMLMLKRQMAKEKEVVAATKLRMGEEEQKTRGLKEEFDDLEKRHKNDARTMDLIEQGLQKEIKTQAGKLRSVAKEYQAMLREVERHKAGKEEATERFEEALDNLKLQKKVTAKYRTQAGVHKVTNAQFRAKVHMLTSLSDRLRHELDEVTKEKIAQEKKFEADIYTEKDLARRLQDMNRDLEEELEAHVRSKRTAQSELNAAKIAFEEEKQKLMNQATSEQDQGKSLKAALIDAQNEIKSMQVERLAQTQMIRSLTEQNEESLDGNSKFMVELEHVKGMAEEAKQQTKKAETLYAQLKSTSHTNITKLKQELSTYKAKMLMLQKSNAMNTEALQMSSGTEQTLLDETRRNKALTEELALANNAIVSEKEKIASLQKKCQELEKSFETTELAELRVEVSLFKAELKDEKGRSAALQLKLQEMATTFEDVKEKYLTLLDKKLLTMDHSAQLRAQQKEIDGLKQELEHCKNKLERDKEFGVVNNLKTVARKALEENNRLISALQHTKEEVKKEQTELNERNELEVELKSNVVFLDDQVLRARDSIVELHQDQDELRDKITALETELENVTSKRDKHKHTHRTAKKLLKTMHKSCGFKVGRRSGDRSNNVLVLEIAMKSKAYKAGVRMMDQIIQVNGRHIKSKKEFHSVLEGMEVLQLMSLLIIRPNHAERTQYTFPIDATLPADEHLHDKPSLKQMVKKLRNVLKIEHTKNKKVNADMFRGNHQIPDEHIHALVRLGQVEDSHYKQLEPYVQAASEEPWTDISKEDQQQKVEEVNDDEPEEDERDLDYDNDDQDYDNKDHGLAKKFHLGTGEPGAE